MTTTQNGRPISRGQKRVESIYISPRQNEREAQGLSPIKLAWADPVKVNLTGVDSESEDVDSSYRNLVKKLSIQADGWKK